MAGAPDASRIPAVLSERAQTEAHGFVAITITLDVIAATIFSARMWTRNWPVRRMSADDYVCALAFAMVIVDTALYLQTVNWVFGRDLSTITLADVEESFFYAIIGQPFWAWSMSMIKISVALMLLRLEQQVNWRRFLWAMVGLQLTVAIYNTFTQLLQCIPLHKAWDLLGVVEGKCWSASASKASSILVQVINILTDWIFALLPISFLRKVQRPLRERIVIGILMALGIFAGGASIVKIVLIVRFGKSGDSTAESIQIGLWSCVEEQVAFIAACVPCLRAPFQRVLEYLGLATTHHASTYPPAYANMYGHSGPAKHSKSKSHTGLGSAIKMRSLRATDAQSEEHILTSTGEEAKGNEIWCTTEVRLEEEQRIKRTTGDARDDMRLSPRWDDEGVRSGVPQVV